MPNSVCWVQWLTNTFLSCLRQIIQTPGLWETTGRSLRLDADSGQVGSSCYCVVWLLYPVGDDDTTMRTLCQTLQNLAIMSFMLRWRKHDAWSITRMWWGRVDGESVCVWSTEENEDDCHMNFDRTLGLRHGWVFFSILFLQNPFWPLDWTFNKHNSCEIGNAGLKQHVTTVKRTKKHSRSVQVGFENLSF